MSKELKKPTKEQVEEYRELKAQQSEINKKIRKLEGDIKAFFKQEGLKPINFRGLSLTFEVKLTERFSKDLFVKVNGEAAYNSYKQVIESLTPVFSTNTNNKQDKAA